MNDHPFSYDDFLGRCGVPEMGPTFRSMSCVVCLDVPGTPVVFVSSEFERHTGYSMSEAIGRSLSFLQGPLTEPDAVEEFRRLIRGREPGTVRITNYRKDGTSFRHLCELRPVHAPEGKLSYIIAVQRPDDRA